jgi:thiamine biosynthesis lipoprotein
MGSSTTILVVNGPVGLVRTIEERLLELVQRWSRFLTDSEITTANLRLGEPVRVSAETMQLVRLSAASRLLTGGLFDPTLLTTQLALGDRSSRDVPGWTTPPLRNGTGPGVRWDERASTIVFDRPFDPGGLGKGLAADLAIELARRSGAAGCLVNIGGDLRVDGLAPVGTSWSVGVEHPSDPSELLDVLWLESGAVATSVPEARVVVDEQGRSHTHLLDPRTGKPAATDVRSATVVAGAGWVAEALTKAVVVGGVDAGLALVDSLGAAAMVLDHDETLHLTPRMERFRQ